MKCRSAALILAALAAATGCLYDYNVKPDYYLSSAIGARPPAVKRTVPDELSVAECVGFVLANNPAIGQAAADSAMAEGSVDIAQSYIIPKVKLEAFNTFYDESVQNRYGFDSTSLFAARLSAQYLLYDFGIARYLLGQRYRTADAARAVVRITADNLAFAAAGLFYTIKAMDQDITSLDESVKSLEARVADARNMLRAGLLPESGVLTLEVAAEDLRYRKASLVTMRYKTFLGLKNMMGIPLDRDPALLDPDTPAVVAGTLPPAEALVTAALARRPEIIAAKAGIEAAALGLRAAEAMRWPLFLIGAEVGYSDIEKETLANGGVTSTATVSMSWDVYSGGEKGANVSIGREQLRKAQLALRQAEDDTREEVLAALADINDLEQQQASLGLAVRSAERNLKDIRARHAQNRATAAELVQAQSSLLQAQTNMNKSRYAYRTALFALEKSIGAGLDAVMPSPAAAVDSTGTEAEPEAFTETDTGLMDN